MMGVVSALFGPIIDKFLTLTNYLDQLLGRCSLKSLMDYFSG